MVARISLYVTLHVHCLCCYYLTYSIPLKFLSSLPNQRYPKAIFIPISPLELLPDFLISSPVSPLVTAFYQLIVFHWKFLCRNFLHYVQSLFSLLHSLKVPILLTFCCVLWPSYDFLKNSSQKFINTFPSPFHTPLFQTWVTIIGVKELKILISCMWFLLFSAHPSGRAVYGVGLRSLSCWDCGFEPLRRHWCLPVVLCVVT